MARWIKIPLGRKVGFDPSDIVLDGDPAPFPQKAGTTSNFFTLIFEKIIYTARCVLVQKDVAVRCFFCERQSVVFKQL